MSSTPNLNEAEANDVLIARADARLAHAYEQIAHADEQLARVTEQLSRMEQSARHPSRDKSALRGLIGLLSAACIGVAAFVFGDEAKPVISRWAPYLMSTQPEVSGLPAQPRPSTVQLAAAEAAPPQAISPATITTQDTAPAVASTPSELMQLVKEMTRVLTNVEQEVEQLKAGQEQMASDNAKVVEQLRASQEQMTRFIDRISEQKVAPKTSVPPPRPTASQAPKPVPAHSSPQARVQPRAPRQLVPQAQ